MNEVAMVAQYWFLRLILMITVNDSHDGLIIPGTGICKGKKSPCLNFKRSCPLKLCGMIFKMTAKLSNNK